MSTNETGISQAIFRKGDLLVLRVKVVPGSSRDRLSGMLGDRFKVLVSSPPEGGKANKAVCRLLASKLGLPRSAVSIVSGQTHALKDVAITGLSPDLIVRKLGEKMS